MNKTFTADGYSTVWRVPPGLYSLRVKVNSGSGTIDVKQKRIPANNVASSNGAAYLDYAPDGVGGVGDLGDITGDYAATFYCEGRDVVAQCSSSASPSIVVEIQQLEQLGDPGMAFEDTGITPT